MKEKGKRERDREGMRETEGMRERERVGRNEREKGKI
jgi:hypothetical protein